MPVSSDTVLLWWVNDPEIRSVDGSSSMLRIEELALGDKTANAARVRMTTGGNTYTYLNFWYGDENGDNVLTPAVSPNTFGILRIDSATTNTMVAVPWTWYSKTEASAGMVKAYKLVKTTNLTAGDMLYAYVSDGHYAAWCATATATAGVLSWEPVIVVANSGLVAGTVEIHTENVNANPITLPRGAGVWLSRQHPLDAGGNIRPFWIYAQSVEQEVTTTIAPISDIQEGKPRAERSTMLGNPYAEATVINDLVFEGGTVSTNDTIIVPNGTAASKYLRYCDTGTPRKPTKIKKWIWSEQRVVNGRLTEVKHDDVTVPAGLAFWYVRRGEGALSVRWPLPVEE